MLHDRAENGRLQVLPFGTFALRDGYEIVAEEHPRNTRDGEDLACKQRRRRGAVRITEIGRSLFENDLPWQELQGCRIGRSFGLDKHAGSRVFSLELFKGDIGP